MPVWELLVIASLILLNSFFAMSELAVVSSRHGRLKQLAKDGDGGAAAALELRNDPTRFLSTVQIGITLIGILAGAYSGATLAEPLARWLSELPVVGTAARTVALSVVVIGITYASLVVGELVPKRIALAHAERIAALVARPMKLLASAGAPVVWVLRRSTEGLLRLLGFRPSTAPTVTEEEVRALVAESTEAGVLNVAERDMIDGVLRMADRPVRTVMTPRLDVTWLRIGDPPEILRRKIMESGHSRFPVSRTTLDEFEGVVHAKDLLDQFIRGGSFDLAASLREPLVVHERVSVLALLEMFRRAPVHMAMVVDEYGGVEGIITPADILGAIAGDLPEGADAAEAEAVRREDGSWLMDGRISLDDLQRLLSRQDLRPENPGYHTLAGLVLWRLEHVPEIGEGFEWQGLRFEVVDMDGRRIDRVLVSEARPDAAVPAS